MSNGRYDTQTIAGNILLRNGLPAGNLTVRIYNRGFAGAETKIGETKTAADGSFSLNYNTGGKPANLEVRILDRDGNEVAISETRFNVGNHEVLSLIAPAGIQPVAPEYQRLTADLEQHLGDAGKLSDAREDADRRDLTILHEATGWDARIIALAVTANKLASEIGLPENALYGLLRVGLPSDKELLATVSSVAVEKALRKARDADLVDLDDDRIQAAVGAFEKFARKTRLTLKAPSAPSTVGELLNVSGLSDDDKEVFAELYFANPAAESELWQMARDKGISEARINDLRLQGKLSYLTLNNAPLVRLLQEEIDSPDQIANLVAKDLHKEEEWKKRLTALAGDDEQVLARLIPPAFSAEKTSDRLDSYAAELARKVRLSFPMKVVAREIETGGLRVTENDNEIRGPLGEFLRTAEKLGFALGRVSVSSFVEQNKEKLFNGVAATEVERVTQAVKKLHRLYQITPSDHALKTALDLGFNSARDVAAFSRDEFLDRFGKRFQSRKEAELVYLKAQQVSAASLNLFGAAKQLQSTPAIYAISPSTDATREAIEGLIKQYPTMETLFGSLDYCSCEHCRSMLSPAAYFVDLLQFLDPHKTTWDSFLADWKTKHGGNDYPGKKPYEALVERRPDLPHIALTCENTNTALPYIDVVNEILEYYVANSGLGAAAARNTEGATTAELLAEPQNVVAAAYDALTAARYPLLLPFDLWLETVRAFCAHFDTPLWQVLETFRQTDRLFPDNRPKYSRSSTFAEYLGVSPSEYKVLTEPDPAKWYELYGYSSEADALKPDALKSARTLARRLGVSYKELDQVVRTTFVNPEIDHWVILRKLGVDVVDVLRYYTGRGLPDFSTDELTNFQGRLDALTNRFKPRDPSFDAKAWIDHADQKTKINGVLVLVNPKLECNFELTTLRYGDSAATGGNSLDFLRLNLFVRLWKRLGWSIEETDCALRVFLSGKSSSLTGASLKTALVYLAHLKALDETLNAGRDGRVKLLTFWSNIATLGSDPLYDRLFLVPSVLGKDPVFDDPFGDYVAQARAIPLGDHLLALQGALNLTASEIQAIRSHENIGSLLTLANVSMFYRYGLLAKALKMPVKDLVALKEMSGLEPFKPLVKPLDTDPAKDALGADYPFTQTLRFVELASKVKESGFSIEDLLYILRDHFDPAGKYRKNPQEAPALVNTLSSEIGRIKIEHAVPAEPLAFTDDVLRQTLALLMPADVAEAFMAWLTGSTEAEVSKTVADPKKKVDPAIFANETHLRVSYRDETQRVAHRGLLLDLEKSRVKEVLKAALDKTSLPATEKDEINNMFAGLLDAVQAAAKARADAFFADHLKKSAAGGWFEPPDFDLLFNPNSNERDKRAKLAETLLPAIQRKLIRETVLQTLVARLGSDLSLTEALVTNARLLKDPASSGNPALDAFAAADERGVTVAFDGGNPQTVGTLDTAASLWDGKPAKPAGARSARFDCYFEAPASGAYRIFAFAAKKDAVLEVRIGGAPNALLRGKAPTDNWEISESAELKAGAPYALTLDVPTLSDGDVRLLIQGDRLVKGPLSRLVLYPASSVERVRRAFVLLSKTLLLIQGLALSHHETEYLATHAADFNSIDFNKLPALPIADAAQSLASARELFGQFMRLADYSRLKKDLAGGTEDLIGLFESARRNYPAGADVGQAKTALLDDVCKRFAELTRGDFATVKAMAARLELAATDDQPNRKVEVLDLVQEKGASRLWEALRLVERLGVNVESIASATGIVAENPPKPRFEIARDFRNIVKARYEPEAWLHVAKPIFDSLRKRQRDALSRYVMHKLGFSSLEQLFEYFLIDAGMEPVVQTSRLRLAISSVQTFVQRCLLNLEPEVHPSTINSPQWQWMKRYRVWEAGRKIFLYPENFLEPEFRDDKTSMFQELESALLQGDVSEELVEDALFNYLKQLDAVARLDIVAMCEEKPGVFHVIGRTFSSPHKYFHRRIANGVWAPWEPITVDVEGDHVVPVFWRNRLHLFWLTFVEKAGPPPATVDGGAKKLNEFSYNDLLSTSAKTVSKTLEAHLNWSEYFQGQWSPRESPGVDNPVIVTIDKERIFISVTKEFEDGLERVKINLTYVNYVTSVDVTRSFRVVSKNSRPEVSYANVDRVNIPYTSSSEPLDRRITRYSSRQRGLEHIPETGTLRPILEEGTEFFLATCNDLLDNVNLRLRLQTVPFFYQDNLHTFYVEPTFQEATIAARESWIVPIALPEAGLSTDEWWERLPVEAALPVTSMAPGNDEDSGSRFRIWAQRDWVTHPATVLKFGASMVGSTGGLDDHALGRTSPGETGAVAVGAEAPITLAPRRVHGGGAVREAITGLTVVGSSGLNEALLTSIHANQDRIRNRE